MNFETKLRELAEKAQSYVGSPWHSSTCYVLKALPSGRDYPVADADDEELAEHIAFNDPETAKLVADVIAAARSFWRVPLDYTESRRLEQALVALDAHHTKREER